MPITAKLSKPKSWPKRGKPWLNILSYITNFYKLNIEDHRLELWSHRLKKMGLLDILYSQPVNWIRFFSRRPMFFIKQDWFDVNKRGRFRTYLGIIKLLDYNYLMANMGYKIHLYENLRYLARLSKKFDFYTFEEFSHYNIKHLEA